MVTYMDLALFQAAEKGDMEPFNAYQYPLHQLVDANENTVLHIYSMTSGGLHSSGIANLNFLQQLIDRCPQMLLQGNARGEIPLHVAARNGHSGIVQFFIDRSKDQNGQYGHLDLLRMRDNEQNTALHKAAQYGHLDVVLMLLKEGPNNLSSDVNTSGESPIYIAARGGKGYHDLVAKILDTNNCEPEALVGPRRRTILHAAALANNKETVRVILKQNQHLAKQWDEDGWTPLHYAAHFGHSSIAKLLLKCDASTAYITDKNRGMSPLHMAAWQGNKKMMELIISHCPGCLGIVDKRGWNFLHFALATLSPTSFLSSFFNRDSLKLKIIYHPQSKRYRIWKTIEESKTRNLLDAKDENGITPLHILLYGPARYYDGYDYVVSALKRRGVGAQIPFWDEYSQASQNKKAIERVLKKIGDIEVAGKPVHDSFRENMKRKDSNTKTAKRELMEKVRETHLLVATLVATVTFAAALTVPGGYKSDQGAAILSRNTAFQAFVITDSMSFVFSLSAVFIHFFVLLSKKSGAELALRVADSVTYLAMLTMVIAFTTGLYAVLESSMSALAISACSISIIIFYTFLHMTAWII